MTMEESIKREREELAKKEELNQIRKTMIFRIKEERSELWFFIKKQKLLGEFLPVSASVLATTDRVFLCSDQESLTRYGAAEWAVVEDQQYIWLIDQDSYYTPTGWRVVWSKELVSKILRIVELDKEISRIRMLEIDELIKENDEFVRMRS